MVPPLFQAHPMIKCIDTAMDILIRGVNRDRIFRMSMSFGDFLLDYSQKGGQRNKKIIKNLEKMVQRFLLEELWRLLAKVTKLLLKMLACHT